MPQRRSAAKSGRSTATRRATMLDGKPVDYWEGDMRRGNNKDGSYVGLNEIIATPVFYKNRVYVAIGRDPVARPRPRDAHCIDATKSGDITRSGKIWSYAGWAAASPPSRSPTDCFTSPTWRDASTASTPTRANAFGSTIRAARSGARRWWPTARSTWARKRVSACWRPAGRNKCSTRSISVPRSAPRRSPPTACSTWPRSVSFGPSRSPRTK